MKVITSLNRSGKSGANAGTMPDPGAYEYPGVVIMWQYQAFWDEFPPSDSVGQDPPHNTWAILATPLQAENATQVFRMEYIAAVAGISTPFTLPSGKTGCTVRLINRTEIAQGTSPQMYMVSDVMNLVYADMTSWTTAILRPSYDVGFGIMLPHSETAIPTSWQVDVDVADLNSVALGTLQWRNGVGEGSTLVQTTWFTRSVKCSIQTGKWTGELDWWLYDFDPTNPPQGQKSFPYQIITSFALPVAFNPATGILLWPAFKLVFVRKGVFQKEFGVISAGDDASFTRVAENVCAICINYMDNP